MPRSFSMYGSKGPRIMRDKKLKKKIVASMSNAGKHAQKEFMIGNELCSRQVISGRDGFCFPMISRNIVRF